MRLASKNEQILHLYFIEKKLQLMNGKVAYVQLYYS